MGYADGYYYGQGRIICDTSTFSVGDTIRVRSMTDSNKVWNKTVATVGTALVFTVPCYDYYKICTVQTISDVETEIGGEFRTLDYGQTIYVDTLNKATLGGIQSILNAHQELNVLAIGDEVDISVNGSPWTMQVGAIDLYDSHEVIFVSKNLYMRCYMNTGGNNTYYTTNPVLRTNMQAFYSAIAERDKQYIKSTNKRCVQSAGSNWTSFSDYVYPPNDKELFGVSDYTPPNTQIQFPIFTTQSNRIKLYNGEATSWWTCDGYSGNAHGFRIAIQNGSRDWTGHTYTELGMLPCFTLTADS